MTLMTHRPVLRGALVLALMLSALVAALQWQFTERARETTLWVDHSHAVQGALQTLLSDLQDIESGARGFALTGSMAALVPYDTALAEVRKHHAELCELVRDNASQRTRCEVLAPLIDRRVRASSDLVQLRRDRGANTQRMLVSIGSGQQLMDQVRQQLSEMQTHEALLLQERSAAATRDAEATRWLLLMGSVVSVSLLLAVFGWTLREQRLRLAAQQQRDRFFGLSLDLLCIAGTDGHFKQVNPAFTEVLGWSTEELLERPFLDFVHPDDVAATAAAAAQLASGETASLQIDNRYRTKSGQWRWLSWRAQGLGSAGLLYATARDITEVRASAELLRASEENLAVTLQSIGDAVLATDAAGRVHRLNPVAERLTGWSESQARGRPVEEVFNIVNESTREPAFLPVADTLAHGTLHGLANHTVLISRDGSECPIADSCAPIFAKDRSVLGAVLVFRDVTEESHRARELQQLNDSLAAATAAAQAANQAKSDFLATMSHEIRTPMNGVIGMVDVLHQTSLTGPQVEMVDLIRESALSLLDVIEDILDFSKIEAGRLEIESAPMSLEDIAEKACGLLEQMARRKQVALRLYVDPALPALVQGDALRVRQVLLNLVNNGIKFSSGATHAPRVELSLLRDDSLGGVRVEVRDNGIGMDEAAQGRLFRPFSQADVSTTRRYGGTGLGLAISRHLVELMGGSIAVHSVVGAGASFTVALPLPGLPSVRDLDAATGVRDSAVVLVGAGPWADRWASYLQDAGAQLWRTPDAEQPVALPPDAPGRPVWLLAADEGAPPPIETLQRCAPGAGWVVVQDAHDRLDPPYSRQDPVLTLDANVLKRRTLLRAVAAAAGRVASGEDEHSPHARAGVAAQTITRDEAARQGRLILVAEDNETNQEVIRRQLALLGHAADVVANGRMALQRWRSGEYALLLTDLHMPELDGYELAQAIRHEDRGGVRRPIIALSANAMKDEALRCDAAGMDGYLSKPAQLAQLKATLERWLPPTVAAPAAPPPAFDLSVLERLVGDEPAVTTRILREFVHTGREVAQSMSQAGRDGDTTRAAAQAHKLGSSAAAVGARDLAELCRTIEASALGGRVQTLETLLPLFQTKWREVEAQVMHELPEASMRRAPPGTSTSSTAGTAASTPLSPTGDS